jgi:hypothetical protein
MFCEAVDNSQPRSAQRLSRRQLSVPMTRQILVAVLLFDLAGAGTIFGLGEAQAGQRHGAASSSEADIGPHLAARSHVVAGEVRHD